MSDNYKNGGNLELWYNYTKDYVLSDDYLIYVLQALPQNYLKNKIQLNILSIGANDAIYEEKLLNYIKNKLSIQCCMFVYDKQIDIRNRNTNDFRVLDNNKYEKLNSKFDIIFDLRSSIWYSGEYKFFLSGFSYNKLIKKYLELLNEDGILLIDNSKKRKIYTKDEKSKIKKIKKALKKEKNLNNMIFQEGLLLEQSTYEKIEKYIHKRNYKVDFINTQNIIGYIKNEKIKEKYCKNEISFVMLKK